MSIRLQCNFLNGANFMGFIVPARAEYRLLVDDVWRMVPGNTTTFIALAAI